MTVPLQTAPATGDNSNALVSTGWVRAQGYVALAAPTTGGLAYAAAGGGLATSANLTWDPAAGTLSVGGTDSFGALTLIGSAPGADAAGVALYNVGGGAGASISLNYYCTSVNGGIPQAQLRALDDGAYSTHLIVATKAPGAAANALVDRVRFPSAGGLEVRSADGTTVTLAIAATGDLATVKGVTYSWPTANAAGVLTNDGAGALSWAAGGGGGTAGAPTTATYLLQTANASLPNAQALGALATGLLLVTTGTGVLSTATPGTHYVLPSGSITGTASNITGTTAIANGGTGATNATAAFNALSPMTAIGDLTTNDGTNGVRLAGNTTPTRKFLRQTGTGTVSALPAWDTLVAGDIPAIAEGQVTNLTTDLASKAPLASPAFTGRASFNAHTGSWGTATDATTTTYDLSLNDKWKHTLGGNRTLALANVGDGQTFIIRLAQDATTGSRTVTWWSGITWMTTGGAVPTLATAVNKVNVFSFVQTGTNTYDGFAVGSNA
jgi:hypothetical protein